MSGARFERALIVDWSGAATPTLGTDSCWVASGRLDRPGPVRTVNHPTRQATMAALRRAIDASLAAGERTLIAIDVSLGLAAGCAATLGLPGRPPWRALWRGLAERIEDDAHNANNRFAAADAMNAACGTRVFWGRPVGGRWEELVHLPHRDVDVAGLAPMPLARLRACEELAGPGVLSSWMLSGRGSVGGQVLTCLPHLERMRQDLGDQLAVWPFEGPGDPGHPVVLAAPVNAKIVILDAVSGKGGPSLEIATGKPLDLHAAAHGKVALAFGEAELLAATLAAGPLRRYTRYTITSPERLRREVALVRQRGWATAFEEGPRRGMNTTSAPLVAAGGRLEGSIGFIVQGPARAVRARQQFAGEVEALLFRIML